MPQYAHSGLYFTPDHIQQAQNQREREPFKSAWAWLDAHQPTQWDDELITHALRWRLNNQHQAGEQAAVALQNGLGLDAGANHLESLTAAITLAQAFELVRGHSAFTPESQALWLSRFAHRVDDLNHVPDDQEIFVEHVWRGLLNVAAGIVLEEDARFEVGAEIYRQAIQNHVRPEGYLPRAVEGEDGGSLQRQLMGVAALVLMAEAAEHVGVDLWSYTFRGISIITATLYCVYYYYYADQWRWDKISEADGLATYQHYGAFLEIVNRRARPRDLKLLLEQRRPLYNSFMGGLTTLTHAPEPKRGLFG